MTYQVFYTNFGYYSSEQPVNFQDALTVARASGFEARIDRDGQPIGAWSPLYGYRSLFYVRFFGEIPTEAEIDVAFEELRQFGW
jgi:hypothetical protein